MMSIVAHHYFVNSKLLAADSVLLKSKCCFMGDMDGGTSKDIIICIYKD